MPYQNLSDGLYWIDQKSAKGVVDHHAILEVGNRLGLPEARWSAVPVVVHQTPPEIRFEYLEPTSVWRVREAIIDEAGARERLRAALFVPGYNMLSNNCEHLARSVATGKRESWQVQLAVVGAVALYALTAG